MMKENVEDGEPYMSQLNGIKEVTSLLRELRRQGHDAYIVGGFVRDCLLGVEQSDVDVVTNAPIEVLKPYQCADLSKNKDGFEVIVVLYEGRKFEVSSMRGKDIYEDLRNRDFTINSLAYALDEERERLCLVHNDGAYEDLLNKVLRIGDAGEELFKSDPLRVLRGLRFAAKYGLDVHADTYALMKKYANALFYMVDKHRVYEEFMKGLSLPHWKRYVELCVEVGLSFTKLPSFERPLSDEDDTKYFKDVSTRFLWLFRHTDVTELRRHFTTPKEVETLLIFYLWCWREYHLLKELSDYELYQRLSKRSLLWEKVSSVLYAEGERRIVVDYEFILQRGRTKDFVKGKEFVTGKDVFNVLGLKDCPLVGELISKANDIIMDSEDELRKDEILRKLFLLR